MRCSVRGCGEMTNRFALPSNELVRLVWMQRSGNQEKISRSKYFRNCKICPRHFSDACYRGEEKLQKSALPSLYLPDYVPTGREDDDFFYALKSTTRKSDYNEPSTEETCFRRPEAPYEYKTPEIVKEIFKKLPIVDTTACSLTFKEDDSPLQVKLPVKVYTRATKAIFTPPLHSDKPGSSTAAVPDDVPTTEIPIDKQLYISKIHNEPKEQPSTSNVVPEPELQIQDVHQSTRETQPSKAIGIPLRRKMSTARKKTSINKSHLLKAKVSSKISKIQNEAKVFKTPNSNNFCRLCFKTGKPQDLQNLEGEYVPIAPVVNFLEVVLGYKFPESTCESCFQEITRISLFIEKCLDAQQMFKQITEDHEYVAADENENRTKKQKKKEKIPGSHATTVEAPKVCDKCGETTTSLSKHYKISKECQPKNLLCAECGKRFASFSTLDVHMGSHMKGDSLPFMCHICPKMFRYDNSLKKHLQVHNFGNQFVCEKCGKCFTGSLRLQKHLKRAHHTGKRPYNCPECSKAFTEHSRLKYHMGVHTREKTFVCDLCNRSFYWQKNLIVHRRIHTGERPYACHVCGESYRESYERRKHIIRSHGLEQTQFINIANISES